MHKSKQKFLKEGAGSLAIYISVPWAPASMNDIDKEL